MISKEISLSALLLVNLTPMIHSDLSNAAQAEAYKGLKSEWKYLEHLFVLKPANIAASRLQTARSIVLGIAASTLIGSRLYNGPVKDQNEKTIISTITSDIFATFSVGTLGFIAFEAYSNYINASVRHEILVNFLRNWDFHKQCVPTLLIPAFDELAAAFNASRTKALSSEQVDTIFEIIQHLIEHEFEKRYEKDKKKDTDNLGMFKTLTDISKNLK